MRRTILQVTAFILVALTSYVLMEVIWTLQQAPVYSPLIGGSGREQAYVSEVLATNRLQLATGEEVRLAAITVPEAGKAFAEEGKQATRALTLNKAVRLVGELSSAYLYLPDEQLLQVLLIEGGYAKVADDAPLDEKLALLRQAESKARDGNLGVWQGESVAELENLLTAVPTTGPIACEPSLVAGNTIGAEEAADNLNQNVNLVFLPIRAVGRNGSLTLMSGLTEEEFAMVIPAGLASTVDDPALLYLNRCLVVSGPLERATIGGGTRIVLREFEQILILK
jgi:endonuclease YncB( thermonuclease family)